MAAFNGKDAMIRNAQDIVWNCMVSFAKYRAVLCMVGYELKFA
jgi:hypothetical protein